ncbi:hypothetical protein V6Z11_D01G207700 [Gossypium hirsutum]
MRVGWEVTGMGWDLTLRAPSRRALSMNSIWLQEEGEGKLEGSWMENRFDGLNQQNEVLKGKKEKSIDPILGFNLEGRVSPGEQQRNKIWSYQMQMAMEQDLEDETLIGEEGKKRNRREMEGVHSLISAAAKRHADRAQ